MSEFIRLTDETDNVYFLRASLVEYFFHDEWVTHIYGTNSLLRCCKETPEEIMALIEGKTTQPVSNSTAPMPEDFTQFPRYDARFKTGLFLWAMMALRNNFHVRRSSWTEGVVLKAEQSGSVALCEDDINADDWELA